MILGAPKDVEISQTGLNDLQRIKKYSELLFDFFESLVEVFKDSYYLKQCFQEVDFLDFL